MNFEYIKKPKSCKDCIYFQKECTANNTDNLTCYIDVLNKIKIVEYFFEKSSKNA